MTQTKIGKQDPAIIPVAIDLIRKAFSQIPGMEGREVSISHEGKVLFGHDGGSHIFWICGGGEFIGQCTIFRGQWRKLSFNEAITIRPEQLQLGNKQKKIA